MIVAVTGHRPLVTGGYSDSACNKLISFARHQLELLHPDIVLTGMAQGWDQAIAVACRELAIPYDAYVPFVGQEKMWPSTAQDKYWFLLSNARQVVVVCEGEYASWKMMARNSAMVDELKQAEDRLLALWDEVGHRQGGTANCVRYAESKEKVVVNVWGEWERFRL